MFGYHIVTWENEFDIYASIDMVDWKHWMRGEKRLAINDTWEVILRATMTESSHSLQCFQAPIIQTTNYENVIICSELIYLKPYMFQLYHLSRIAEKITETPKAHRIGRVYLYVVILAWPFCVWLEGSGLRPF